MKNIYSLLIAALVISSEAGGKTTGVSVPNIFPHYGSGSSGGAGQSPGSQYSRIAGVTYLKYSGFAMVPVDSTTYAYSFGRGGELSDDDLNDNFVSFDESWTYLYNPDKAEYRNQFRRKQTFSPANKVMKYNCESWSVTSDEWEDSARYLYTYNNDQTKLEYTMFQIFQSFWMDHVEYDNIYDPVGRVVSMHSTALRMDFLYDAANNITERTDQVAGYMQPFRFDQKHLFTYNVANQMTSYIVQDYDNGWVNFKKYEYTYNGPDLVMVMEYNWINNSWKIQTQNVITYDSNHNKLMDVRKYWDESTNAFVNFSRLQWTYNSFGQPLTYFSESFELATGTWVLTFYDFLYRYYYDSYTPASTKSLAGVDMNLELYPLPAKQILNLRADLPNADGYNITVFDTQGKILRQMDGKERNVQQAISVGDLASGNYFLKISNSEGQQTKQFVVTH